MHRVLCLQLFQLRFAFLQLFLTARILLSQGVVLELQLLDLFLEAAQLVLWPLELRDFIGGVS